MNYLSTPLAVIWVLLGTAFMSACSSENHALTQDEEVIVTGTRMMAQSSAPKLQQENQYLAYEHSITVAMAASDVAPAYESLAARCSAQPLDQCTLMTSNLRSGGHTSAHLRMRIAPANVAATLAQASELGEVTHQNTHVDDLQNAIVDNDKRLEMLLRYRDKLEQLEKTSAGQVESLIRIASELSRVQSDLEYAQGEKARLLQRVDFQWVNIHLETHSYTGFWSPISESAGQFGQHLSEGLAYTLTVFAYGLPGLIMCLAILIALRWLWRKLR